VPAGPWLEAGFEVEDGAIQVGDVRLRLAGGEGGIGGWTLAGAESAELDGLPTDLARRPSGAPIAHRAASAPHEHRNGVVRIDHLVVFTPGLGRTVAALEAAGLSLRRIREPDEPGPPVRQAFFRLGEVILEVVEQPRGADGPARFWGMTFCVADLDACADLLGDRLGEPHDAVQPGRRIATVRREAGLGLPVALISA
jgi:hypothetical protein